MGCGSSRQTADGPTANSEVVAVSPGNHAALNTSGGFNQPSVVQQQNVYSPTSSRIPLTTTSLQANSAVSSPRPSHAGRSTHQTDEPPSDHINHPLVRPKAWKSQSRTWTAAQLQKERQDFFDTRVTGLREVWEALRQVTESVRENDLTTAQALLDAVSCTLPTGKLEDGLYDQRGNLYKLPLTVLSDPTNMISDENVDGETMIGVSSDSKDDVEIEKSMSSMAALDAQALKTAATDKGKAILDQDALRIKCRLSNTGTDVIVSIGKSQKASYITARLREQSVIPSNTKIRMFYLGKELKEKKTLEDQDYREGHVINCFVADLPS